MNNIDFIDIVRRLFEGITTLADSPSVQCWTGVGLIILGALLVFLGKRGVLEPLLMIPMGLGMIVANAGNLYLDPTTAIESERVTEARWINSENRSDVRYFTVEGSADFSEEAAQTDKFIHVKNEEAIAGFLKAGTLEIIDAKTQKRLVGNVLLQGDLNVEPLVQGEENIVALMLQNYGFDVIDLGKDVPAETILDAAQERGIKIVGLSALMTTTMTEMDNVIKLARFRGQDDLTFIVGGAVLSEDYARKIGAFYAKDAMETVKIAKKFTNGVDKPE